MDFLPRVRPRRGTVEVGAGREVELEEHARWRTFGLEKQPPHRRGDRNIFFNKKHSLYTLCLRVLYKDLYLVFPSPLSPSNLSQMPFCRYLIVEVSMIYLFCLYLCVMTELQLIRLSVIWLSSSRLHCLQPRPGEESLSITTHRLSFYWDEK